MKKRMKSEVSKAHRTLARGSAESKRLAAKGHKAVAVVLTMKTRIERSFYAMGKALVVLDDRASSARSGIRASARSAPSISASHPRRPTA